MIEVGRVHELVRYPIKSMAGITARSAWPRPASKRAAKKRVPGTTARRK